MAIGTSGRVNRPSRAASLLGSTTFNAILGILGLIAPLIAYAMERQIVKDVTLLVAGVVIIGLVARLQYLRMASVRLRRAKAEEMSDPAFFREVEAAIMRSSIERADELVDGYVTVFAAEVPPMSVLLYRTLAAAGGTNRRVRATDLTSNPKVLLSRREYLAANRHLISSGGTIERVFICRAASLADEDFARHLLLLIEQHRMLGVQCGLAVRENVRSEDALDAVIFGFAAVLVESEQANVEYTTGWSTIHFRRVETWLKRFDRIWQPNETPSATGFLATYENAVRPMLDHGVWDVALAEGLTTH